jgi:phosphatidylglycerophosphate synthase
VSSYDVSEKAVESKHVKHALTEELLDLHFNRPLAAVLVRGLLKTPITANQVTIFGMLVSCVTGYLIAVGTPAALAWAAFGLFATTILDCTDGQLARHRGGGSQLGRALDGGSDYVTALALHLGIWWYAYTVGIEYAGHRAGPGESFGWILLAGISMALHCGMYDYRKQWFLAYVAPSDTENDSVAELRAAAAVAPNRTERFLLRSYVAYASVQARFTGGYQTHALASDADCEAFVTSQRGFMRALDLNGPSLHLLLMTAAALAALRWPLAFWWYVLFMIGPMNVVYAVLVLWGRRIDRRIAPANT